MFTWVSQQKELSSAQLNRRSSVGGSLWGTGEWMKPAGLANAVREPLGSGADVLTQLSACPGVEDEEHKVSLRLSSLLS